MTADTLPAHWSEAHLRDIVHKLVDGSHTPPPKQKTGLPMLSALNISNNAIDFTDNYRLIAEDAFAGEDRRTSIAPGDVLLTIVGAIGRAAVVPTVSQKFTIQRSVAVLGPTLVDPKFLMYQLEAPRFAAYLRDNARGTAQKGVYLNTLAQAPTWIAPLREQRRIVTKIEELFSELDKGIEALTTAREQLNAYRQSVLKHAFEGKLTEDWRKFTKPCSQAFDALPKDLGHARSGYYGEQLREWEFALQAWVKSGEKGKRPSKPEKPAEVLPVSDEEITKLLTLPMSWSYVRLSTLAQIGSGMSVSKDRLLDDPVEVPYLRVANVQRGKLDLAQMRTMRIEKTQLPQLVLKKWDVLFNEGGDRDKLGRGCPLP